MILDQTLLRRDQTRSSREDTPFVDCDYISDVCSEAFDMYSESDPTPKVRFDVVSLWQHVGSCFKLSGVGAK